MEQQIQKKVKYLWIDPAKCMGCGKCLRSCPVRAIDAAFIIDSSLCIRCGRCLRLCWFGAIDERTDNHAPVYHVHNHTE